MNNLVRKTLGTAALGVFGLGGLVSCDSDSGYSGRGPDAISGIEYADGGSDRAGKDRNNRSHYQRRVPCRSDAFIDPDSVSGDTVIADVVVARRAFTDTTYAGVVNSPPPIIVGESASEGYSGANDTLNVGVLIAREFRADTVDLRILNGLDPEQRCLTTNGRDTLQFDLVLAKEIVAKVAYINFIR